MKLEQQVVSLELAKQLKELGVKQDSLFYWIEDEDEPVFAQGYEHTQGGYQGQEETSAFTVAELGGLLPSLYHCWKPTSDGFDDNWYCGYFSEPEFEVFEDRLMGAETEADARAKMLIWLMENGYIDSKESK